ncbi:hypothetical protein HHK36_025412 [Tetracentron sinense]|uniref:F-box/LRR-repeat protein 15-like leucin rich repeat domain-containing protein n=1 Tax=Tetracentron sinense TaxID=13715 RepID=A0A834YMK4_TETSI|nr:hypothetical protein HHK36_025412 [Tetracentron sinense]
MTILRSREIIPKSSPKTLKSRIIEPPTPKQFHEDSKAISSPSSSPAQKPELDSVSVSGTGRRRSLRLASKFKVADEDVRKDSISGRRRERESESGEIGMNRNSEKDSSSDSDAENVDGKIGGNGIARVLDSREKKARVFSTVEERVSVSVEADMGIKVIEDGIGKAIMGLGESGLMVEEVRGLKETELVSIGDGENEEVKEKHGRNLGKLGLSSDSGSFRRRSERIMTASDAKGKRKLGIDLNSPSLDLEVDDGRDKGLLSLGSRVAKRRMQGIGVDSNGIEDHGGEDKESKGSLNDEIGEGVDVDKKERDPAADESSPVDGKRSYSSEEKGKGKLVKDSWLSIGIDPVKLDLEPEAEDLIEAAVSGLIQLLETVPLEEKKRHAEVTARIKASRRRQYKEMFQDTARQNASRFAHFHTEEEEDHPSSSETEREIPSVEADPEIEDWPGPFSTAMKIIKERAMNLNVLPKNLKSDVSKPAPLIEWMPSKDEDRNRSKPSVPSLQDLCLNILAKNAEAIASLEHVPDVLRHKLSQLLCDSRRMDSHFMSLLVNGAPTEIRINDCSWITEEQFTRIFKGCDLSNLMVLQLDLCGRCMPDDILPATLAHSPNSLPALSYLSLRGACRLSDIGLNALVASAPTIRSLNLSQCSFLTSTSIIILADSLGSVLRELYIDDCQNIDVMLILPALKKIEHLEVLSVTGIQTVCDDFVSDLITLHGPNMKELVLADCVIVSVNHVPLTTMDVFIGCRKLTNASLKVIAENCPGLYVLNLINLRKLTDSAIRYLANGCRKIHTLKLCRNTFSDEAIAAFLEASGESLKELSLNNVSKVGHNTAISLARCSRKLLSLDLSWCRNLTDEALGLIVDSCLSLRLLKLFGCTQQDFDKKLDKYHAVDRGLLVSPG